MADKRVDRQQNQNKQQKKKGLGGWLWVVLIFLLPNLIEIFEDNDLWWEISWFFRRLSLRLSRASGVPVRILVMIGLLVLVAVALGFAEKVKDKKEREEKFGFSYNRQGRVSAAVNRPDPRSRSFQQPDPYCVVCDHTGEDHFEHDKKRRLEQLNDWLKNGLIDREEYKTLRYRYERDL